MTSLKTKLKKYYDEINFNYDIEEIDNVLDILNNYDDDLNGLSKIDKTLLVRLIDNEELINMLDEKVSKIVEKNPFN